jgi:2-C-methyl-D-erythritol 4-phosphate cytidylyltransferase
VAGEEATRARVAAVVLAAGAATRMAGTDKVLAPLDGRPLIHYGLSLFERCPEVDAVVIVSAAGAEGKLRDAASSFGFTKVRAVVTGGAERRDSAAAGLAAAEEFAEPDAAVLIHDAARPLARVELIARLLEVLNAAEGAVPAVPVTDTIKTVAGETGEVVETLPRERLRAIQTPQAFKLQAIAAAYRTATAEEWTVTDDAAVLERAGGRVVAVEGDPDNFKITYPEDLARAERVLEKRNAAP